MLRVGDSVRLCHTSRLNASVLLRLGNGLDLDAWDQVQNGSSSAVLALLLLTKPPVEGRTLCLRPEKPAATFPTET